MNAVTPFPAVAGSPVEKTEDPYFCRNCYLVAPADHMPATGAIYCAECDSEDVIPQEQRQRELLREREEYFAEADRRADARYSKLGELL